MAEMKGRGADGFTILEVLIALAILSASLAVFYSVLSQGSRADLQAEMVTRASMLAESKMAAVGVSEPMTSGTTSGDAPGGLHWTLEIKQISDWAPAREMKADLFDVIIHVTGGEKGDVRLHSLRLAPAR